MQYRYGVNNGIDTKDLLLIGNPEISYFSSVYRKHTKFSIHRRKIGNVENIKSSSAGGFDLIKSVSLELKNTVSGNIPHNYGTSLIDYVYYSIDASGDDNIIEKLSGSYIEKYNQLHTPMNTLSKYGLDGSNLVVKSGNLSNILSLSGGVFNASGSGWPSLTLTLTLPLPFSFSQNIGNAMPYFLFRNTNHSLNFLTNFKDAQPSEHNYILEMIKLSQEEKNRFIKSKNEYIYTNIKEISYDSGNILHINENIRGNVKSIIWDDTSDTNYTISINNLMITNSLEKKYFSTISTQKAGLLGCGRNISRSNVINTNNICYYTFGLKEAYDNENDAPTGSISHPNKIDFKPTVFTNEFTIYVLSYSIINYEYNKIPKYSIDYTRYNLS
jgi:hypothetical protein